MSDERAQSKRLNEFSKGFLLGSLKVLPKEGLLTGAAGEVQLEPRVMDVLVILAANAQSVVSREQFLEMAWGDTVVSDDALARCIYILRHELSPLLDVPGERPVIETLRKRGVRLNLPATPINLSSTTHSHSLQQTGKSSTRSWELAAILVVFFVALGTLWWAKQSPDQPIRSIAVLAFMNLTGDEEMAYLTDGFSEQLSHALANVDELRVAARTSTFYFKEHPAEIPEIARRLDVDALLEGSIRREGSLLRVTLQLIRSDGFHVWSREYDRPLVDTLRLQSEIAAELLTELGFSNDWQIDIAGDGTTENAVAYDHYLRGRYRLTNDSPDQYQQAIDLFEKAVFEDPGYALPYTGIADTYSIQLWRKPLPEQVEKMKARAQWAIDQALTLAPKLSEAHASQGLFLTAIGRYPESEAPLRHAIELNPNYLNAHNWLGLSLVYQDRFNAAIEAYRKAHRLDPLSTSVNRNLGANLMLTGQFEDAMRYLQRVQALDPEDINAYRLLASWSAVYGRLNDSLDWAAQGLEYRPDDLRLLVFRADALGQLGQYEQAQAMLAALDPQSRLDLMAMETHFSIHLAQGNGAALALRQQELANQRTLGDSENPLGYDRVILRWRMINDLNRGDAAAVAALAENFSESDELTCGAFGHPGPKMYWSLALEQLGQSRDARLLAKQCLMDIQRVIDNGGRYPTALYRMAVSQALAGESEAASRSLSDAIELDWMRFRLVANDPAWALLESLPGVREAVESGRQRLEELEMRSRLREL